MKTQTHKDESAKVKKEIEQALTSNSVSFEDIPEEGSSPLNQPVVEKESHFQSPQPAIAEKTEESSGASEQEAEGSFPSDQDAPLDAPEQQIESSTGDPTHQDELPEIPLEHATIAAETVLGVTDNILEVGGGFFIRIRKHEDFYEFKEVVQVIDEQNEKNIKRLKLDEEDKALLRPLLIIIIRKRAQKLTTEQQLAAAAISIIIKKIKLAAEIRAENNMLVERIRDIVRQETVKQPETLSSEQESPEPSPSQNSNLTTVLEVAD